MLFRCAFFLTIRAARFLGSGALRLLTTARIIARLCPTRLWTRWSIPSAQIITTIWRPCAFRARLTTWALVPFRTARTLITLLASRTVFPFATRWTFTTGRTFATWSTVRTLPTIRTRDRLIRSGNALNIEALVDDLTLASTLHQHVGSLWAQFNVSFGRADIDDADRLARKAAILTQHRHKPFRIGILATADTE